jgi:hypothetical protein
LKTKEIRGYHYNGPSGNMFAGVEDGIGSVLFSAAELYHFFRETVILCSYSKRIVYVQIQKG